MGAFRKQLRKHNKQPSREVFGWWFRTPQFPSLEKRLPVHPGVVGVIVAGPVEVAETVSVCVALSECSHRIPVGRNGPNPRLSTFQSQPADHLRVMSSPPESDFASPPDQPKTTAQSRQIFAERAWEHWNWICDPHCP
jgi:hypothetical protein